MKPTPFYHLSLKERLEILVQGGHITPDQATLLENNQSLPLATADHMIENAIGTYALPLGIGKNFVINGKEILIPMAIEEPSVVAAASNGAKMARAGGGINAHVLTRLLTGEIVFTGLSSQKEAKILERYIHSHQSPLIQLAESAHPSLKKRGGGIKKITSHFQEDSEENFLILYVTLDTQEAMGANMTNTMLEALAHHLETLSQSDKNLPPLTCLMAILSNYATKSLVQADCEVPVQALGKSIEAGTAIAERIVQASRLAQIDPYRACTHNKGIMNGVDAVLIASGNDWRANEAACHAYAAKDGKYRGLSQWTFDKQTQRLKGTLTLPLTVGSVGGSIKIHPTAQIAHQLMQSPNAKELMLMISSVGLCQNLAALRALVSDGIQAGHMALQSRSLAMSVGAKEDEIEPLTTLLKTSSTLSQEVARRLLSQLRQNTL